MAAAKIQRQQKNLSPSWAKISSSMDEAMIPMAMTPSASFPPQKAGTEDDPALDSSSQKYLCLRTSPEPIWGKMPPPML